MLVFVLAVPFWLMGALVPAGVPLPMRLPVSALQILCPIAAAVMLTFRAEGRGGVRRLLRRAVDFRGVRPAGWYAPVLLLVPSI